MRFHSWVKGTLRKWFPRHFYKQGIARLKREHEEELRKAPPQEHPSLNSKYHYDLRSWNDWLLSMQDAKMVRTAEKMDIFLADLPYPEYDEDDPYAIKDSHYYHDDFGEEILLPSSRDQLRQKIRERQPAYRKERREEWQFRISSAISIIGALTGLMAVIHGKGK